MAYIIAEPCIGTKDTACVEVCPVDCIHPTKDEPDFESAEQLYIDPEVCIDCGVCLPECPIGAIVGSVDESPDWAKVNAELTPAAKDHEAKNGKAPTRPANDPPKKAGNKLVK